VPRGSGPRAQARLTRAARQPDPVAIANAALLGIVWVDFKPVFFVPNDIFSPAGLGADIVLAEDPTGRLFGGFWGEFWEDKRGYMLILLR
jgi:hypothetical protein